MEPLFRFNGEEFPLPNVSSLSFRDTLVLNRVCQLNAQQFALEAERATETYIMGLLAIGLRRLHPDWPVSMIEEVVGAASMTDWDLIRSEMPDNADSVPLADGDDGSSEPSGSTVSAVESEPLPV